MQCMRRCVLLPLVIKSGPASDFSGVANSEAEIEAQADKAVDLSTTSNMHGQKPMALPELTARLHDFYSKLNPSKLDLVGEDSAFLPTEAHHCAARLRPSCSCFHLSGRV